MNMPNTDDSASDKVGQVGGGGCCLEVNYLYSRILITRALVFHLSTYT